MQGRVPIHFYLLECSTSSYKACAMRSGGCTTAVATADDFAEGQWPDGHSLSLQPSSSNSVSQ
jgi:hypothetical protein